MTIFLNIIACPHNTCQPLERIVPKFLFPVSVVVEFQAEECFYVASSTS